MQNKQLIITFDINSQWIRYKKEFFQPKQAYIQKTYRNVVISGEPL